VIHLATASVWLLAVQAVVFAIGSPVLQPVVIK
jgi:hypothetical protein